MVAVSRRQVPPWEVASRLSYRRWKEINRRKKLNFENLYKSFKSYEKEVSKIVGEHTHHLSKTTQDLEVIKGLEGKIGPHVEDICVRFQQLADTPRERSQSRVLLEIAKAVESAIPYISPHSVFKFLVSYGKMVNSLVYLRDSEESPGKFNLKISSHQTSKKLFSYLENRGFEVNRENIVCLLESYVRLCSGYGQDVDGFDGIYKESVNLLTTGKIKLNEEELDQLLLLYNRMGIYDKSFAMYYSEHLRRNFENHTENQVANFCRYMTGLGFVEKEPTITHIDLLKSKGRYKNGEESQRDTGDLRYEKRLPRHYKRALVNRRSYEFKPKIDYTESLSEERQREILKGWDFRNSKFVRGLNKRLPYVLHQYKYFNLIDLAEMYYFYGIKTELLPRFATELWKYLYTLKYGYPIKSLIVLSCLKQGDAVTYGRLIRNIPATLAFNWRPELVAEGMIALGSLGIRRSSVYNKMAEYLQRRILYFENPNLVCRIFEALSLAKVPQYGMYTQVVTLSESFPDWLHLKHLILIAKSSEAVGTLEGRLIRQVTARMDQVGECTTAELIPLVNLASKIKLKEDEAKEFYKFILHFLKSIQRNEQVAVEDLMELLEGMVSMQVRTMEVEKLTIKVLKESPEVEIVKVLKCFGILGKVESEELLKLLGELVESKMKDFEDYELSSLIWDMISVGFELNSEVLLKVVKKFNQLKPKHFNTHLLTVVGSLVRLSDCNDQTWREFLRTVDGYKDYSWSKGAENEKIIRSVANTIKDSKTFVREFPFTIDIKADYRNIEQTHLIGSNMAKEEGCYRDKSGEREEPEDKVALFYYLRHENPFILHVMPDGTHEHYFNFYCQTRKRILRSMGWKDTLIFSPNN